MGLIVIGALAFVGGVMVDAARAWQNYFNAVFIFTGFSLGGYMFIAINRAVSAKWAIIPRRLAEALASFMPVAFVLFLIMLVGMYLEGASIYSWMGAESGIRTAGKLKWLSFEMVAGRNILFFLIWMFVINKFIKYSVGQDSGGNAEHSSKAKSFAIFSILLFAPTFAFFCYDVLMSQEPKWYSTMFTVYTFAGIFQSTLALMVVLFINLKNGQLKDVATPSHVKDISGLLFAFTVFMCYVGFSQFMLIWYANLPEETFFYLKRADGGWIWLAYATWFFKFILPFFGLLGQGQKKHELWLKIVCWGVLIGQFVDIYWITIPAQHPTLVPFGWIEIGTLALFAGLFGLFVSRWMSKHSLIPVGDPNVLASANWRFWE